VKILVVDDHELIREGLRPLLLELADDANAVQVLEAHDYSRALEIAGAHPDLDLALLDFNLPNVAGFAALVDIQERYPGLPVVMMSGDDDPGVVREALERGALGFIPKTSSKAVILNALRLVLSGGSYVPREIMGAPRPVKAGAESERGKRGAGTAVLGLTPRQSEVLELLLAGKSNKVICRELGMAEGTVKNHVAVILKALDATNRVEAVVAAAKLGLKS
jgi:DNA-binding NarL/FixJ family response regulator